MYRPVLVAAPTSTPVNLADVKAQLDISYADKDSLIASLINAAVAHLDGWTGILGRCLVAQTWRQDFDRFNSCLRLPLAPVISITSVKYDDASDVEQTISSANYTLQEDGLGPYVEFISTYSFPSIHVERPAVRVTYVAGYASADAVPAAIRHAMLMLIRHWFDNPSAVQVGNVVNVMPLAVDALLSSYRRVRF